MQTRTRRLLGGGAAAVAALPHAGMIGVLGL